MFGWKPKQKREETEAYQKGEQTAQRVAEDVDRLFDLQFKPVFDAYIKLFRRRIQAVFSQTEAPPLIVAKFELTTFLDGIETLKADICSTIREKLAEWFEFAERTELTSEFDVFISKRIEQFSVDLREAGVRVLADYMSALDGIDATWRKAHPEKASHFPPDKD
jgi:hypothetical protein